MNIHEPKQIHQHLCHGKIICDKVEPLLKTSYSQKKYSSFIIHKPPVVITDAVSYLFLQYMLIDSLFH